MADFAQQLDFLLAGLQDESGVPLSGAIVVTRNSANSAAKAVWEDRDATLPSILGKSQFNLDAEGRAEVFGFGVYTILIYDALDVGLTAPIYSFEGLFYGNGTDESTLPSVKRDLIESTAGQAVFILTNAYTPGVNSSLLVYDNGSLIKRSGYEQTSPFVVTFFTGFPAGHDIEFVSGGVSTATIEAGAVGYTPGGSVNTTTVADRLDEIITVKSFGGAVGDGATDDMAAVIATDARGPFVFTEGTYKITSNTTISSDVVFMSGAAVSPDSGVVVTFSGSISAGLHQIFTGAGSVVLTQKVITAYPEWWGAIGDVVSDDSGKIQACHDACEANSVEVTFIKVYGIGTTIEWSNSVPCNAKARSKFTAVGLVVNGVTLSEGPYRGRSSFPTLGGFSGFGMKLLGTNVATMFIPLIENCGDGIVLETVNATHSNLLDTNIEIQQIGACDRAIVFSADNVANVMQGSEIKVNFINNANQSVVFENNGLGSSPNWDSNKVKIQAIDPTLADATAKGLYNPNSYAVPRLTFDVDSWFGGFAATAVLIDGMFSDLNSTLNLAKVPVDGQINISGTNNNVRFNDGDGANNTPITCATAAASKATFNGGIPAYKNRVKLKAIPATDFLNNTARSFYAYHLLTDGNTNFYKLSPSSGGSFRGVTTDRVTDNSGINANEIVIVLRNDTGATITSGTEIEFALEVGI